MKSKLITGMLAISLIIIIGFAFACTAVDAPAIIPNGLTIAKVGYEETTTTPPTINYYVILGWKVSDNAEHYLLYRSTEENGVYTALSTPPTTEGAEPTPIQITSTTAYTFPAPTGTETVTNVHPMDGYIYYQDATVESGTVYFYKVVAVKGSNATIPSTPIGVQTVEDAPTGLFVAEVNTGRIVIAWNLTPGIGTYKVYRGLAVDANDEITDKEVIGTVSYENISIPDNPSYVDIDITPGETYYYAISAVNSGGEGVLSSTVTAQTSADTQSAVDITPETESTTHPFVYTTTGTLIRENESDWYKVNVYGKKGSDLSGVGTSPTGMYMIVLLTGVRTDTTGYAYPQLSDANYTVEIFNTNGGFLNQGAVTNVSAPNNLVSTVGALTTEGYYYIRVYNDVENQSTTPREYQVTVILTYDTTLNINFLNALDMTNGFGTNPPYSVDQDITTVDTRGEKLGSVLPHRFYSFRAVSATDPALTYRIGIRKTTTESSNVKFNIYNGDGTAITDATKTSSDTSFAYYDFTPTTTGRYTLDVQTDPISNYADFQITLFTLAQNMTSDPNYVYTEGTSPTASTILSKSGTLTQERNEIWYAFQTNLGTGGADLNDIFDINLSSNDNTSFAIELYIGDNTFMSGTYLTDPTGVRQINNIGTYVNADYGSSVPGNRNILYTEDSTAPYNDETDLLNNTFYYVRVYLNNYSTKGSFTLTVQEKDS